MIGLNRNINNIFFIFAISHLLIWTVVPSITNKNLPLDVIEALAWGSNLDWGFNKHPPGSAFFPEVFFQIFGAQDWAYYFLSSLFVVISFYFVFKVANEILSDKLLSLFSVLSLEAIYFYNFTTPEFNVNVCQLPFWSLVVYFSWKIYSSKEIKLSDCFLIGLFGAIGFLSKYLFVYLLASIFLLFAYLIFIKKDRKFDFKYFIILEVFIVLLVPHLVWLYGNDFITIFYGLKRTGLESSLINHFEQPIFFLSPIIYSYVSISQTDKRTDYPGKEIASKAQLIWSKDFNEEIQFVTGDEWKAGNLSYHLKSRPVWEGSKNNEILKNASQFICIEDVCLGRY